MRHTTGNAVENDMNFLFLLSQAALMAAHTSSRFSRVSCIFVIVRMAVQLHDYHFAGMIFQKKHEVIPHVLKNYFRKQNQADCFFLTNIDHFGTIFLKFNICFLPS